MPGSETILLCGACIDLFVLPQGETEGFVRFDSAESAEKGLARADADGTVQLGQGDAQRAAKIALITGDEEQALVDKVTFSIEQATRAPMLTDDSAIQQGLWGRRGCGVLINSNDVPTASDEVAF